MDTNGRISLQECLVIAGRPEIIFPIVCKRCSRQKIRQTEIKRQFAIVHVGITGFNPVLFCMVILGGK